MCDQKRACTFKFNHVHCALCGKIAYSSPCLVCVWRGRVDSPTNSSSSTDGVAEVEQSRPADAPLASSVDEEEF